MKKIIAFGLIILFCYVVSIGKIIKEEKIQHFKNLNQIKWFVINWLVLVIGVVLIAIGLYNNYHFYTNFESTGIYCQGEITHMIVGPKGDLSLGDKYGLDIEFNGNEYQVYSWSDVHFDNNEKIGVYVIFNESSGTIEAMIEGQRNCQEGETLIMWGLIICFISFIVFMYRYNIE